MAQRKTEGGTIMKRLLQQAVLLVLSLAGVRVCLGQTDTARLQGTVTDPQGAAVAGAIVTVTDSDTGRALTVQTNGDGFYVANALPVGHYHVVVEKSGFEKAAQDLELQVAQIGVVDFKLVVGATTQTVTVEAGSPVIDAASSSIGTVIGSQQIEEIPLNGRNFTQLAELVPGVTRGAVTNNSATGSGNNAETFRFGQEGGASLAVNGLRPQNNNFILDGIDNNEALVNTIVFFPPADAINEFRVQTSVAPAEFGRAGGGLVLTSIKSGTNTWHGSAFWFNRNTQFDARDFFNTVPSPKPGFERNQFGGTLGFPIMKDKWFLFGDYEGLRLKQPGQPEYATVPTDLMRNGDFSELLCGGANPCPMSAFGNNTTKPQQILDPSTGTQFMGNGSQPNVIPSGRINPVGQAYLKLFPEPNCNQSVSQNCFTLYHNYTNIRKLIENWNDFDIRTDYVINSNNTIFGRFSRGRADQTDTTRLATLPSGFGSGTNFNHPWGTSIGWTDLLSANLVNEAHVGFVRTYYGYTPPGQGTDICTQIGILNCNTALLGGIALIGGYNNQIEYTGDYGPYLVPQTGYNANDSLTWTRGRNTFKFGGNIIRRQLNLFRPLAGKGYFAIAGNGNSPCCGVAGGTGHTDTGYEVSDLLAGFVDGYGHGVPFGTVGTRTWENGFFAQDDFRVNPRLTLNLGLRWDILTWPVEVFDRQANFDLTTGALVVAGSNGASRTLIPNDYHDFGPRLGFAYALTGDGKTVLRGGYGLFYFLDRGGISNQLAQNPPFSGTNAVTYNEGYKVTLSGMLPCSPNCTQADLISTNATAPLPSGAFTNLNLATPTNVSVIAVLPTNVPPSVSEWNLQVEREIATNQSISIAYVGTHGSHLTRNYNVNQNLFGVDSTITVGMTKIPNIRFPNLGSITTQDNQGKSDYHSLQAQYEHRFVNGLQFTGAFTWSKATDDSCGDLDACAPQLYTDFALEHGLSNQDQDYRMVLSWVYELPIGRGKRWGSDWSRPLNWAAGGWQLNGVYSLQGGFPFSVTVDGTPSTARADVVGKASVNPGSVVYINNTTTGPFVPPASTKYPDGNTVFNAPGTSGRNMLRGPGLSNIDLAVFKNIYATERIKGEFRVQAYNLTNTPHLGNPDGDLSHGDFGHIISTVPYTQRFLELGLRITF
jgi:hypothetical protein